MNWKNMFDIIIKSLPVFGEFIGYIINLSDKEWEEISKAWPHPTKTNMAMVRAEVKAHNYFFENKKENK